ncbi:MetQ/NlpA family ABC transporter substrate-binding protein [Austwickia chelonae]|uniref:MetQ/NlpA family ABC transporter substrate-binding protein n=1 Tax=Austwickia chelonae TaxID=100225 RepID=UPI000E28835A|nr:MetQ/NlpA family ABC transporter substrate-binding protein [Austwickia chelonae]
MLSRRAAISLTALATLSMSACGAFQNGGSADPGKPLTVIADAEPHSTLLKQVQKDGLLGDVKLQIREISGGVDPNQLVSSGDVDINFFQHTPYLKNWNAEHKTDLVNAGPVHIEPLGLYSKKVSKVDEVPQSANIAIPADPTNQARALFLLADAGLLTMDVKANDPGLDFAKITEKNIKDNPKQITFTKIDRPQLFASLSDPKITLSVVNGNYALEGGLNPGKDALVLEKAADNPYVNILVTRAALEKDPRVVKLAQALRDVKTKTFIQDTYKGSVLPAQG